MRVKILFKNKSIKVLRPSAIEWGIAYSEIFPNWPMLDFHKRMATG